MRRRPDIGDDLTYRRTVALFSRLQPGEADQLIDPEQENRWAKLQFELKRSALLTNAIGSFRTAVELDQRNEDAKVNLELALRAYGPMLFPSNAPDTGGAHGQESGQGRSGSGY